MDTRDGTWVLMLARQALHPLRHPQPENSPVISLVCAISTAMHGLQERLSSYTTQGAVILIRSKNVHPKMPTATLTCSNWLRYLKTDSWVPELCDAFPPEREIVQVISFCSLQALTWFMFQSLVFMYFKNCRVASPRYIIKNPSVIKLGQNDKLSTFYCMGQLNKEVNG